MCKDKQGQRWVNFQQLKQEVSFEEVLGYYGLLEGLRRRGDVTGWLLPEEGPVAMVSPQSWSSGPMSATS